VILSETPGVAYSAALAAADVALRLDPNSAEAHAAMASIMSDWQWDFEGAEQSFQRALALQPQYAAARQWYAQLLQVMGRTGEAITQAEEALRTDELSVSAHAALGISYYMAGRYTEALERLEVARDRFPDAPGTQELLGWTLRELGRFDEAIEAHRAAVAGGQGLLAEGSLALALAAAGRSQEAEAVLRRLESEDGRIGVLAVRLAQIHAHLGDLETAFERLETAFERRDPWMTYAGVDPAFAPLHGDARFDLLIERIGLPSG